MAGICRLIRIDRRWPGQYVRWRLIRVSLLSGGRFRRDGRDGRSISRRTFTRSPPFPREYAARPAGRRNAVYGIGPNGCHVHGGLTPRSSTVAQSLEPSVFVSAFRHHRQRPIHPFCAWSRPRSPRRWRRLSTVRARQISAATICRKLSCGPARPAFGNILSDVPSGSNPRVSRSVP